MTNYTEKIDVANNSDTCQKLFFVYFFAYLQADSDHESCRKIR